jgi:hypothetical protein
MDVHVKIAVTRGLRRRGVDVLTAQEDGAATLDDSALLDRATQLGRTLFTQDVDLLNEASQRQQAGVPFAGVVYAQQRKLSIGRIISELEIVALAGEPSDMQDRVEYLPI